MTDQVIRRRRRQKPPQRRLIRAMMAMATLGLMACSALVSLNTSAPAAAGPVQQADLLAATSRLKNVEAQVDALRARLRVEQSTVSVLEERLQHVATLMHTGQYPPTKIVITEAGTAHDLIPPRLKLSVLRMSQHLVTAQFGTFSETFRVARTVDFTFDGRSCYLVLDEATRDRVVFHFGCGAPDA